MSRQEEARAATSALTRYIEPVCEAAFQHRGTVENTDANLTAIDSLLKNRLAFRTDDDFGVQLTGVVMRMLHHVTKTYRLRLAVGSVADMLEHLKTDCENYRRAQVGGQIEDQQGLEADIQEQVFELVDLLRELIQQFSFWVHTEFGTFSSIDIKIAKNQEALSKIGRLNQLFAECTIVELNDMAGNDPLLSRLLMKTLKRTMDDCRQELVNIAHRLREILARLQNDRENQLLNHLVDTFAQHYQRHPGFAPNIDLYSNLPDSMVKVAPLLLVAYPNLASPTDHDLLTELACQAAASISGTKPRREKPDFVPVTVGSDEPIPEQVDPIYSSVDFFFDALLSDGGLHALSASEGYQQLELDVEFDIWLMVLISRYRTQDKVLANKVELEIDETPVANYSGNHVVRDLKFRKVVHG